MKLIGLIPFLYSDVNARDVIRSDVIRQSALQYGLGTLQENAELAFSFKKGGFEPIKRFTSHGKRFSRLYEKGKRSKGKADCGFAFDENRTFNSVADKTIAESDRCTHVRQIITDYTNWIDEFIPNCRSASKKKRLTRIANKVLRIHQKDGKCIDSCATAGNGDTCTIHVAGQGDITGTVRDDRVEFLGIRYGDEPLRFAAPKLATTWNSDATKFQPNCHPGPTTLGGSMADDPATASEDCLFLNIKISKTALSNYLKDGSTVPVLLWIHGGAFAFGSGNIWKNQPDEFVSEQNVMVVTVNYRLGPFGFWFLPTIEDEYQGNWGILDQRLSMEWTKLFISNFGGNSEKITISGSSSGAESALYHLHNQDSHPFFDQVFTVSHQDIPPRDAPEAGALYGVIAQQLGCVDANTGSYTVECVRNVPIQHLMAASAGVFPYFIGASLQSGKLTQLGEPMGPVIDGKVIQSAYHHSMLSGKAKANAPLLVEITQEESDSFVKSLFNNQLLLTHIYQENYPAIKQLQEGFGILVPQPAHDGLLSFMYGAKYSQLYGLIGCPGSMATECEGQMNLWMNSWAWTCPIRKAFNDGGFKNKHGDHADSYIVVLDAPYPEGQYVDPIVDKDCSDKTCHAMGLYWLFNNAEKDGHENPRPYSYGQAAPTLSQSVVKFGTEYRSNIAEFMRTGNVSAYQRFSESDGTEYNVVSLGSDGMEVSSAEVSKDVCDAFDHLDMYLEI